MKKQISLMVLAVFVSVSVIHSVNAFYFLPFAKCAEKIGGKGKDKDKPVNDTKAKCAELKDPCQNISMSKNGYGYCKWAEKDETEHKIKKGSCYCETREDKLKKVSIDMPLNEIFRL